MSKREVFLDGELIPVGRVFCIGRNYAAHAAELGNEVPSSPVVFMKPSTCVLPEGAEIPFPAHGRDLQHEAELVLLIGRCGRPTDATEALDWIEGISLGLDLTLRDVQSELKKKGLPWEKAKAFEGSAPVGNFQRPGAVDLSAVHFQCEVNEEIRQRGNTSLLLFPVGSVLMHLGKIWDLEVGDLVFTGTPAGVGPLNPGDSVQVSSEDAKMGPFQWTIGPEKAS